MRINLHLYPSVMTNESRILKIARSIKKTGCFDTIVLGGVTCGQSLPLEETVEEGVKVKRFRSASCRRIAVYLTMYLKGLLYMIRSRPTMVNIHSVELLLLAPFAKSIGAEVIYDTHEYETEKNGMQGRRKRVTKWIERKLLRYCDHVFVVGEAIADEYQKLYPSKPRPDVVLNVPYYREIAPSDRFRENLGIDKTSMIFLYQGSIGPGRGIEMLLEALSDPSEFKNKAFVFMGYGSLVEMVQDYAERFDHIYYHRAVSPDELYLYTASADVGFSLIENSCLSYYYCMPNKLFEYVMSGLPVIAADLFELKRFIEANGVGWVLKEHDSTALRQLIASIGADDLRAFESSLKECAKRYHWEHEEKKLLKKYVRLCEKRST